MCGKISYLVQSVGGGDGMWPLSLHLSRQPAMSSIYRISHRKLKYLIPSDCCAVRPKAVRPHIYMKLSVLPSINHGSSSLSTHQQDLCFVLCAWKCVHARTFQTAPVRSNVCHTVFQCLKPILARRPSSLPTNHHAPFSKDANLP